jgi:hypothetical protein
MSDTAQQIKEIFLMGRKARSKEEQEEIMRLLQQFSTDYSSKEYAPMGISEFMASDKTKASLSPREMLESYYGQNLNREIIRAGNYNIARPTISPESFPAIFDRIQAQKDTEYGSYYSPSENGIPRVVVSSGEAAKIFNKNAKTYRKWLQGNDPELKKRAIEFFQANSIDPSIPHKSGQSSLEHEIGHHITTKDKTSDLLLRANNNAYIASNRFEDFGAHTGRINETTQALSRLQREMFKETGKRINNPKEFMNLVNSEQVPNFLTQEGRRILIYARNLKKVADNSDDETKKKSAKKALKAISESAPSVVQNEKQIGLNLMVS